jgi:hypothetical protein
MNIKAKISTFGASLMWSVALMLLFSMDTTVNEPTLCIPRIFGFQYCPGCGIGHAIHHVLHFRFAQSLHEHWLGIPATIGILYMISKPFFQPLQIRTHYESTATFDDAPRPAGR